MAISTKTSKRMQEQRNIWHPSQIYSCLYRMPWSSLVIITIKATDSVDCISLLLKLFYAIGLCFRFCFLDSPSKQMLNWGVMLLNSCMIKLCAPINMKWLFQKVLKKKKKKNWCVESRTFANNWEDIVPKMDRLYWHYSHVHSEGVCTKVKITDQINIGRLNMKLIKKLDWDTPNMLD